MTHSGSYGTRTRIARLTTWYPARFEERAVSRVAVSVEVAESTACHLCHFHCHCHSASAPGGNRTHIAREGGRFTGGPADHRSPGTTVRVVDPATGRVHASLSVPAGRKWRLAVLPGGRTLVGGKGVEGEVVALAFVSDDCEVGADCDRASRTWDFSRVKVWRCWQFSPAKVSELAAPEKPRVCAGPSSASSGTASYATSSATGARSS